MMSFIFYQPRFSMQCFVNKMGRIKQVTPRKRAIIAQYSSDGLTQREIAGILKNPKSTVGNILLHVKTTGSSEAGK